MNRRVPILGDHKRVKSRLITPFNDLFGPIHDVSWINTMIPELLWIALLHDAYGDHRAVEIVTAFTRDVRAHSANFSDTIWAAAGKFAEVPDEALEKILVGKDAFYADEMRAALTPLAAWYPAHPLNAVCGGTPPIAEPALLVSLGQIVADLYDRSDRDTMMVQATAIWVAFDSGRLKVASHLALASFPKIQEYPETELSQRVAASIRSSLNQMFGDRQVMASTGIWPVAFWNQGLQLQPCEVDDEGR